MNSSISTNVSCGFDGNSDIYGVGIRVGYYTQALAVYFANMFLVSEAKSLRAVNSLFLLALSIVTVIYAYNAASVHAIEVFILLQTGLCLGIVSIMEGTRYSSKYIRVDKGTLIIRTILMNFGLIYNLYFWWWGLDSMEPTPCGTYIFYVVRANIYGPARTAMKVFAIIGLASRTLFTTAWDAGVAIRDLRLRKARALFVGVVGQWQSQRLNATSTDYEDVAVQTESLPQSPIVQETNCRRGKKYTVTCTAIDRQLAKQHKEPDLHRCIATVPIVSARSGTTSSPSDCAIFGLEVIREAENYLNHIFTAELPVSGTSEQYSLPAHSGGTQQEHPLEHPTPLQKSSYWASLHRLIKATWADQSTRRMKDTLSIHSKALNLKFSQWPQTVNRMISFNSEQESPNWRAVAIASDIQLTQMPVFKPTRVWVSLGAQNLGLIVILIVQIELTISWNHITDLSGLDTIGQLFPLILGVGSLLQVFWEKGHQLWKGIRSRDLKEECRRPSKYELAMEQYLEWKKQQQATSAHERDKATISKST